MIKRDGVELVNANTTNVKIGRETLDICKNKKYTAPSGNVVDLSLQLDHCKNETILYEDDNPIDFNYQFDSSLKVPFVEILNETTSEGASRCLNFYSDRVVALNFASARNQGGGFLSGAVAQEEDLCRASGLYPCLKNKPMFYNKNILCDNAYYTDGIIYSPDVPFFRDNNNLLLEKPFPVSIISAPAPNVRAMDQIDEKKLQNVLNARALKIIQIAHIYNHQCLILGAWGCGAFGNKPEMVVEAFMKALKKVPSFKYVSFSVFDNKPQTPIFNAFVKLVFKHRAKP